jgi:hypothetical protein
MKRLLKQCGMVTALIVVSAYVAFLALEGERCGYRKQALVKWIAIAACLIGLILDCFV